MSTIEDRILDGPRVHYCDDGDDDVRQEKADRDDQEDIESSGSLSRGDAASLFRRPCDEDDKLSQSKWRYGSSNTGPKGVLEDFKKRTLSKDTSLQEDDIDELDAEFQELMNDDSILKEHISKRISETVKNNTATFGQVYHLQTGNQLLEAIDRENPSVLVIVHIYTKYSRSCSNLNRCLNELAKELTHLKFVTLDASVAGLSGNFKDNGVPALLAYRGGDLVKSLVQLEELLDKNFDTSQVKELLIDNKLIKCTY